MTNLATALADVLAADRHLARLERREYRASTRTHIPNWWDKHQDLLREVSNAKATLEATSEELIAAMDEHVKATIYRAVASMPGHTTEQGVAP